MWQVGTELKQCMCMRWERAARPLSVGANARFPLYTTMQMRWAWLEWRAPLAAPKIR